jgi:hypothetical protein
VCFFSATFGAGVVAAQRPIARPKRHLPSARYVKYRPKLFKKYIKLLLTNNIIYGKINKVEKYV